MEALKGALLVGVGGFLGALARWGLTLLSQRVLGEGFPAGTLICNLLGCFLIGGVLALLEGGEHLSAHARLFLVTGLLGSLTTFSTFGAETLELAQGSEWGKAAGYLFGNVVIGLAAVALGRGLALKALAPA